MSFRSIIRDVRDGFGSLSRRSFEVRLTGHGSGKSQGAVHELHDQDPVVQNSCWGSLPPELLRDVIRRLEASESTWPFRKNVVACAGVCKAWRDMCKEIVRSPEFCGKLTFPVSLKQDLMMKDELKNTLKFASNYGDNTVDTSLPVAHIFGLPGPRDGTIQCFIKRDKSNLTYHLYLCLSPAVLVENGKFLLSAKRTRRTTSTEYIISMDADNISRSKNTCIGKLRSNFLGTKFIMSDTQPPYNLAAVSQPGKTSRRFHSKKVSPRVTSGSYNIAQITYELNVLGTRGPRRMHCTMYSIPASALDAGGIVPGQPDHLFPRPLEESFRSMSFSKSSVIDSSRDFNSSRFSEITGVSRRVESSRFADIAGGSRRVDSSRFADVAGASSRMESSRFSDITGGARMLADDAEEGSERPLVLRNKAPRWHEQLQCWCLNFRGRVTVASVKNFQLIAAAQPAAGAPTPSQPAAPEHDKIILQFGKVANDMFTMDYRYPLSAFQAFAICLSSFDTKLACE